MSTSYRYQIQYRAPEQDQWIDHLNPYVSPHDAGMAFEQACETYPHREWRMTEIVTRVVRDYTPPA